MPDCSAGFELSTSSEDVRLLRRPEDLDALAETWRELESCCAGSGFFQSYAWCAHVAQTQSVARAGKYEPLVAVYRRDGDVAAIWPLSRQRRMGIWQLRNLDDPFGQFGGALAVDEAAETACVAMALQQVRAARLASQAQLERLFQGSPTAEFIFEAGATKGELVSAAVVNRRDAADFEQYRNTRKKKTMKNLRNVTNKLERAGEVQHMVYQQADEVKALIERVLESRQRWMAENGMMTRSFRTPGHAEILTGGQTTGLSAQKVGFELLLDGKPIAHQWGYLHQGRYYAYMSGADLDMFHLSPGRIHLSRVVEAAFELGVDALELLTPASRYKMSWANEERPLVDALLDLDLLGSAKGRIWDRGARPVLKKAFYRLPTAARKRLAL